MVKKLNIGEELQHPAWSGPARDAVLPPGLKFIDTNSSTDWIVKLQFHRDGDLLFGSGFFLKIPSATHDLILTAGHNLIGPTGNLSSDLRVLGGGNVEIQVPVTEFRVSAAYKANQTPATDYGAILLPRNSAGGKGFGFSLKLAYEASLKGEVSVSGYRTPTPAGKPTTSSGVCLGCYPEQLEYGAQTEQGFSGSPVWIGDEGQQTVIAIHNHRPARARAGSRGSRLTPKLLREVFGWVGAGQHDVKIRARDTRPKPGTMTLPPRGLFLCFTEDFPFARVRLGAGTAFEVLPARVSSEKELYVLAVGGKWVMFNPARKEAVLTEKITNACLFRKCNVREDKKAMRIVVENGDVWFQLKVQGTRIKEFDGDYAESSEVSIVDYPLQSKELFTQFWFE